MKMKINRWLTTMASIWIQCISGASYTFGIYSSVLKSSQGYDQSVLGTVSVFKDMGAIAGVISGVLYSYVGRRHGPWIVHAAGAAQIFVGVGLIAILSSDGYFFIWLSINGMIHKLYVPLMCIFMYLGAHAQTFFNTTNVVTAVHNFPNYSGTVVGIMQGFLGLSGAVLIQIYQTFLNGNPSAFLLLLAVFPTSVALLFMCFVRIHENENKGESDKKHLNRFSSIALILAAYLLVIIILENLFTFPSWLHYLTFAILVLLILSPLVFALIAQRDDSKKVPRIPSNESSQTPDAVQLPQITSDKDLHKDKNLLQSVKGIDFWLLFVAMLCGMGSGLATVNNISQIGQSLHYKTSRINTLVSLLSIWNFLGRFGGGYISDIFLHNHGWARPSFMAITLAIMSVGHVIIASGFPGNLYIGFLLVGICYGSQWSLMPTIASEIFGVTHMGTIFNTIAIAGPVGSFIFSVLMIGRVYDRAASGKGQSCYGKKCFMLSFFVLALVSLLGFLAALVLFFRTRRFYRQLFARRNRNLARG